MSEADESFPWRRNLVFISSGVVVAGIGFSLITPFIPQYLVQLGVRHNLAVWSGLALAANALTYSLMAPLWGALADRHGKRVMLLRSGFGIALTYLLMAAARSPLEFLLYRAANGMLGGFIPSSLLLVATNSPAEQMGFALGAVHTASSVGGIMGPLVGGAAASLFGMRSTLYLGAAMLCLAAITGFCGTKERVVRPQGQPSLAAGLRETFGHRDLVAIFLVMLIAQTGLMAIQPTLPLFIHKLSAALPARQIPLVTGAIFSLAGLSTALGAPIFGRVRRLTQGQILLLGLLAAALLGGIQGLVKDIWLLGGTRFLFGFANAAIVVAGNVLLAQRAPEGNRGQVFGVLNGVSSLGSILGPLLGGYTAKYLGLAGPFYLSGLLFAAGLPLVGRGLGARLSLSSRRPPEQHCHAQGD